MLGLVAILAWKRPGSLIAEKSEKAPAREWPARIRKGSVRKWRA